MALKLSVLDQSPVSEGETKEQALKHTVDLAQHVEKLGYQRFWVSEHHDSHSLAGSSPEVLISHIAAKTSSIRVGSGGVMLPHYSPYKVAENFRVLEGLNPNRIDLGIGRAPGGMPAATYALQDGRPRDVDRFPEQIDDLFAYLSDEDPRVKASPMIQTKPEVWLLGSSPQSAILAAEKGLPYSFAQFINGQGGEQYMDLYMKRFKPSNILQAPKNMVSVFVICAETDDKANEIASSLDLSIVLLEQGVPRKGTPSPEKAMSYTYSTYEKMRLLENRKRMIVGSPQKVRDELYKLSERFQTNEIMLVTITYDFEAKKKSFELVAEAIAND